MRGGELLAGRLQYVVGGKNCRSTPHGNLRVASCYIRKLQTEPNVYLPSRGESLIPTHPSGFP